MTRSGWGQHGEGDGGSTSPLPFRILVIADALGRDHPAALGERPTVAVHGGRLAAVMAELAPEIVVGDQRIRIRQPADWSMAGVVLSVPELGELARRRLELLSKLEPDDQAVVSLGERVTLAAGGIIASPAWRRAETTWRSLEMLAGRMDGLAEVELHLLPATRAEIEADLDDAPELSASGLYRTIYATEFGQLGGRPWSVIVLGWPLGPSGADVALLRRMAALAAAAHAPLLADAAPQLLGLASWAGLAHLHDLASALGSPAMTAWRAWRAQPEARHAVLALPPVALRGPLWAGDGVLWGGAAHAVAARLARCHAGSGWGVDAADGSPAAVVPAPGATADRPAAAVLLPEAMAAELAAAGLVPVCASRRCAGIVLPHLPSLRAGGAGAGPADQLPLVLLGDRIAQHLKVIQRERLGAHVAADELEHGLNRWLDGLCADGQVGDPGLRARRPLRQARVAVSAVPGRTGWLRADIRIRPHLPGSEADVVLDLVGRLDRGT